MHTQSLTTKCKIKLKSTFQDIQTYHQYYIPANKYEILVRNLGFGHDIGARN